MAWTPPATVTVGQILTALIWNRDVRDNLNAATQMSIIAPPWGPSENNGSAVNDAHFARVWLPGVPITSFELRIQAQAGNIDVGIYSDSGGLPSTRLWSRGSIACPAAGQASILISAGTPTSLTPTSGIGWLAVVTDNVATTWSTNSRLPKGFSYSKTASFPLPASISSPLATVNGIHCSLL